jgi:TRAP-type mannitol/chloroaromatic compound transport system substrate-binding protein
MEVILISLIILLIIFWFYMGSPERMKVGSTGYHMKGAKENMVNQMDWDEMSRGLNISSKTAGYAPVINMLNQMEKSSSKNITTDNRKLDDMGW